MTIAKKKVSKKVLKKKTKRPVGVWLISLFYFFSCSWTLSSFLIVYLRLVPLTAAQETYFSNLTIMDYILTIGIGGLGIAGAVSLLQMKKRATQLFIMSLALNIVSTIWHLVKTNFAEVVGGVGLVGYVIGIGMIVVVILYCLRLEKKGYLS